MRNDLSKFGLCGTVCLVGVNLLGAIRQFAD